MSSINNLGEATSFPNLEGTEQNLLVTRDVDQPAVSTMSNMGSTVDTEELMAQYSRTFNEQSNQLHAMQLESLMNTAGAAGGTVAQDETTAQLRQLLGLGHDGDDNVDS